MIPKDHLHGDINERYKNGGGGWNLCLRAVNTWYFLHQRISILPAFLHKSLS